MFLICSPKKLYDCNVCVPHVCKFLCSFRLAFVNEHNINRFICYNNSGSLDP